MHAYKWVGNDAYRQAFSGPCTTVGVNSIRSDNKFINRSQRSLARRVERENGASIFYEIICPGKWFDCAQWEFG